VTFGAVRTIPVSERGSTTVADVMGPAPPSVGPDDDAFDALRAMSEATADRVLVVEDGRFVGQATSDDFVAAIEVIQGLGGHRTVEVADGYA
jgi:CBS domain-containing protein